jgi:hypothetical protein
MSEERGLRNQVKTDQYGVFHLEGLRVEDQPLHVSLVIRTPDGRAGTYVVPLETFGETIIPGFQFIPDVVPAQVTQPLPPRPPDPPPENPTVGPGETVIVNKRVATPQTPPPPQIPQPARAPIVEIAAPVNGFKTGASQVRVLGTVSDPTVTTALILVNGAGTQVSVQAGRFSADVPINSGWNGIQAQASITDENGATLTGISDLVRVLQTADASTGALAGIVTDQNTNYPVSGMTVRIAGTGASTLTDNLGVWQIRDVAPGTVTLEFLP